MSSDEDMAPTPQKRGKYYESDDDFAPTKKVKKSKKAKKMKVKEERDTGFSEELTNGHMNGHVSSKKETKKRKSSSATDKKEIEVKSPKKKIKKEEPEKWKWWEDGGKKDLPEGHHWAILQHNGPVFAPPYERLPKNVKFYYDDEHVVLSDEAEEVMGFYAKMLDHDYTTKDKFNQNFFEDWRSIMTHEEKKLIKKLSKCDFTKVQAYYKEQSEIRKNRSKEVKLKEKEDKEKLTEKYGYCIWDNHREKIGNYNLEPPGLFRGRGEHPKMGKYKKRVRANQIIINCSKGSEIPQPPPGEKWKEVRHDPTVTWLAAWTENVQNQNKYIMLNANSQIKGTKDLAKYEKARNLHKIIDKIRADYREDLKSKEMAIRQRAVCCYFIDKLALRAGNEKDSDEAADTVGCCSLRCEHIELLKDERIGSDPEPKEYVIKFDFLGKDSIQYLNVVAVEKRVWKNVKLFMENKSGEDDLFDRVDTSKLNAHLRFGGFWRDF